MKQTLKKIASKWWILTVALALVAVAGLRVNAATAPVPAEAYTRIRYICIGDLAVDTTGRHELPMAKELGLDSPEERAQKGCRLPLVPPVADARMLVSATAPATGLGGMVVGLDTPPNRALALTGAALEQAGWKEQGASVLVGQRNPNRQLMTFEREGAWLWAVAVSTNDDKTGSAVLLAGQFHRQLWRMNR